VKKINVFLIAVLIIFYLTGCSTTSPEIYSFVENEYDDRTATITFVHNNNLGVLLINYDGIRLPAPDKNKRWEPVSFPSGRVLNLRVNVYNEANVGSSGELLVDLFLVPILYSKKMDKNIDFHCPPLEQGKNYRLTYNTRPFGRGSLVLTDTSTRRVVYQQRL